MKKEKCPSCGKLVQYHDETCDPDDIRRHKANLRARERRAGVKAAMESIGMVRVKGNLGGTFWE